MSEDEKHRDDSEELRRIEAVIESYERAGLKLSDEGKDQLRRQMKDKFLNQAENPGKPAHRSQDSIEIGDLKAQVKALASEIEDAKEATRKVSQTPVGMIACAMMNQVASSVDSGLTVNEARLMLAYAKSLTIMFEAELENAGGE